MKYWSGEGRAFQAKGTANLDVKKTWVCFQSLKNVLEYADFVGREKRSNI
jgi:hypothetical protein